MKLYRVNTDDDKDGEYKYYFVDTFDDLDKKLEDVSINIIKYVSDVISWNNFDDDNDWLYLYKYNYTKSVDVRDVTDIVITSGDEELFKFFRQFGIVNVNWVQCLGDVY